MEIPLLGTLTKDSRLDWYYSNAIPVGVLGNKPCRFVLDRYVEDQNKEELHTAIANFLSIDASVLSAATPHVFQYYKECNANWTPEDDEFLTIKSADQVWAHVRIGNKPIVSRRRYGDKGIYISLECNCDWEEEHGLQIVFKNGSTINKVGPCDGHLTNSDAYADDALEDVIYASI
jgi:hypothetical protein